MGVQCWLNIAIIGSETLLVLKFRHGLPTHGPFPMWIKISWTFIAVGIAVTVLWLAANETPPRTMVQPNKLLPHNAQSCSLREQEEVVEGIASVRRRVKAKKSDTG